MTLCVICDMLYKSQEGKKKKGHCKAFVAPVDVQLDCDDKTMVQPDILIVCDPDKLIKQCENYRKWNSSAYKYNPSKQRYEFEIDEI